MDIMDRRFSGSMWSAGGYKPNHHVASVAHRYGANILVGTLEEFTVYSYKHTMAPKPAGRACLNESLMAVAPPLAINWFLIEDIQESQTKRCLIHKIHQEKRTIWELI